MPSLTSSRAGFRAGPLNDRNPAEQGFRCLLYVPPGGGFVERTTRFELATPTLARRAGGPAQTANSQVRLHFSCPPFTCNRRYCHVLMARRWHAQPPGRLGSIAATHASVTHARRHRACRGRAPVRRPRPHDQLGNSGPRSIRLLGGYGLPAIGRAGHFVQIGILAVNYTRVVNCKPCGRSSHWISSASGTWD